MDQLFYLNEKTLLDAGCVLTFLLLLMVSGESTYGRYFNNQRFPVSARLAWSLLPVPFVTAVLVVFARYSRANTPPFTSVVFLCFSLVHYIHRGYYGLRIRGGSPLPLYLFIMSQVFMAMNGYLQSRYLLAYTPPRSPYSPHFILGMAAAVTGLIINSHSDHILRNLRKPNETGYKIPRGGMFEYVSCANFFGEIIEWCGYALAVWNPAALTLCVFTIANLGPRAMRHHRYYIEKFEDYPKSRKIIIPYIFYESTYGRYFNNQRFPVPARLMWSLLPVPYATVVLVVYAHYSATYTPSFTSLVLLLFSLVHGIHRIYYGLRIRGGSPVPLHLFLMSQISMAIIGYLQSRYLLAYTPPRSPYSPHFILGMAAAVTGLIINSHSDHILRNLRKPNETGYKIPRGGMFEYVSCANFFGEILEWCGYALAAWNPPALALCVFTIANLGPRAMRHHKYYKDKFEDYPKSRKIIIPYIL